MAFSNPLNEKPNSDILSNLPDGVKEKILTYLPIEEAGRTSILSSKWRHTWASIPELSFSDHKIISYLGFTEDICSKLVKFVDSVFLLHRGPILSCELFICQSCFEAYFEAYDRWILNLSGNEIRKITLGLCSCRCYTIHSSFFSCDALRHITLMNCCLKLPLDFKGFKLLEFLFLMSVKISNDDIDKLVSSSPWLSELVLADLKLNDLDKFNDLKIRAPNLKCLMIVCKFPNLEMCAPKLHYLFVKKLNFSENQNNNFARFFGDKPELENLIMKGHLLLDLCAKPLVGEVSLTFNRLKHLEFELDFEDKTKASFTLALFQRAYNLQSLVIHLNFREEERPVSSSMTFWEKIERNEDLFKHLQKVNIVNFRALIPTISFVKFILGSAPRLLTLTIEEDPNYKEANRIMLEQLMSFQKASQQANVLFE